MNKPKLCSDCHGGDFFNTISEDKAFVQDFCNVCKQPCAVISTEVWKAKQRQPAPLRPNATRDILGVVGQIQCINVARIGEQEQLRYFGKGKGCSGQAHPTEAQATADVQAWHAGKPVVYEQHAVMPLPKLTAEEIETAKTKSTPKWGVPAYQSFVIGLNNTWPQAWEALLAGHQVKREGWHTRYSWIFENNMREILLVEGDTMEEWMQHKNQSCDSISASMMLATDWVVLPKIHPEPITV